MVINGPRAITHRLLINAKYVIVPFPWRIRQQLISILDLKEPHIRKPFTKEENNNPSPTNNQVAESSYRTRRE
jgi:hypothetical protein